MIDLSLSEEQEMLRKAARDFVSTECPKNVVREIEESEIGYSPEQWRKMAELGWLGIIFPERYGGAEANFVNLAILCEEMGRGLLASPYIPTIVCGLIILACGNEEQKAKFIPEIANGEAIFCLALTEPDFGWEPDSVHTMAVPSDDHFTISGSKLFIPYAKAADYILCVTRSRSEGHPEDGISLLIIDKNSQGLSFSNLDGSSGEHLAEIVLENVKVSKANLLGGLHEGWAALQKALKAGMVMLCAEMVGGAQAVVDLTIDYAKGRVQFGQPIGYFQRVQDRIINMVNDLDKSRLSTYEAAWRLGEVLPCDLEVSVAKAVSSDAYNRICLEAHHVFAGVGYMQDFDLYLYTKKTKTAQWYLGDATFHRKIIARELGMV